MKFGRSVCILTIMAVPKRGKNYNISTNYHISPILDGVADGHHDAELLKKKIFQIGELLVLTYKFISKFT